MLRPGLAREELLGNASDDKKAIVEVTSFLLVRSVLFSFAIKKSFTCCT